MKGAGSTLPADGSGGGGGTVGAGLVTYTGIPPSTATNILDEADYRARHVGAAKIIATLADFDFHAPAVGGIRTISSVLVFTDLVTIPSGEHLHFTASGFIGSIAGEVALSGVIGDIDGPLVTGTANARAVTFRNNSAGASAQVFSLTSAGPPVRFEACNLECPAGRVGTLDNIAGPFLMATGLMTAKTGILLTNMHQAPLITGPAFLPTDPGFVGIEVDASVTVATILKIESPNFLFNNAAQIGMRFSNSATYPTGPAPSSTPSIHLLAGQVSGVTGGIMLDQSAGNLTIKDLEIISTANASIRDSLAIAATAFEDIATPANLDHLVIGTFRPFPHQNTVPVALVELPATERFRLVRATAPLDVYDWYVEYLGVRTNIAASIFYRATIKAATGPGDGDEITVHAEIDVGGVGTWVAVGGSVAIIAQASADFASIAGGAVVELNPGDRLRLAATNNTSTADTAIAAYTFEVR